jgi:hypothetical protein
MQAMQDAGVAVDVSAGLKCCQSFDVCAVHH